MQKIGRKYIHNTEFVVQGLYYGQWEDETAEETRKEAKLRLKEYRENIPQYAHRIKTVTTKTLK